MAKLWLTGYILLCLFTAWLWLETPLMVDWTDYGVVCVDDCMDLAEAE